MSVNNLLISNPGPMPSKKNIIPLEADRFYHVYNRGVNSERIFQQDDDYQLFLSIYTHYLTLYVDTYAYCLLHNHFHFLIKVKDDTPMRIRVSEVFRRMFSIYAQNYNEKYNRTGSLFCRPYRRVEVADLYYLKYLIFYIHQNPKKHNLINDFSEYRYSSFQSFYCNKDSKINRKEVLAWFNGDLAEFSEYHQNFQEEKLIRKLMIE